MANLGGTAVAIPQPGEGFNDRGLYVARCRFGFGDTAGSGGASDNLDRWTDTQETVPLFDINSTNVLVHHVYRDVETAFTASVTLNVGDGANTSGFVDATTFAATVISSGQLSEDTNANQEYLMGKHYKTTDSIDIVVGGANPAVGLASIYVVYSYGPAQALPDSGGSANT